MTLLDLTTRQWELAASPRLPLDASLDGPATLVDWIAAKVPGSIQRDLMVAGRLPDLYRTLDLDPVLAGVDASDWWYRTMLPGIDLEERAWLRFEGIDYQAAVTVNGVELGRGAGMFARRQWEVTSLLRQGPAPLGVRVWGGGALPTWHDTRLRRWQQRIANRLQSGIPAFADRLLTLKAPVHFGWDFAPRVLAAGIWDDVLLHTARSVALLDVWPRVEWGSDLGLVLWLELDANRRSQVTLTGELASANFVDEVGPQVQRWTLALDGGFQVLHLRWPQARLRPWATRDRGWPHLYQLTLRLTEGDNLLDETVMHIGARTIGWEAGGRLVLNGARLRLRGVNWTTLDLLRGDPDEEKRCRNLLEAAVSAGVNAVRVWGGGGRERSFFYELCDELGLLVWQELPIACVFLDHLPGDDAFLALARREAQGIIRQLRHHPCLFLWCGGNEWGPGRHRRLAQALSEVAAIEDPGRRWLPASPGPGDSHNWDVWHGKASPQEYGGDSAPLLSEFGLAAPPDVATLAGILPAEDLWPPGAAWERRQAQLDKLWYYAQGGDFERTQRLDTLDAFVEASQAAQARGLQAGIEAYRLRPDAVGAFVWQWNEPWPAISWSVFPYRGPAKAAYQQVARSNAPIAPLARLLANAIELWVVNDRMDAPGACVLSAAIDGEAIWRSEVTPPANDRVLVVTLPRSPAMQRLVLHLMGPGLEAENVYDLTWSTRSAAELLPLAWLRQRLKGWVLRW